MGGEESDELLPPPWLSDCKQHKPTYGQKRSYGKGLGGGEEWELKMAMQ